MKGAKRMSEKRRDSQKRLLKDNESQLKDGRYMYRYKDADGSRKCVYSWRLVSSDPYPKGKRKDISLREKEEQINRDIADGIIVAGNVMTVNDLVDMYLRTKKSIGNTTKNTYNSLYDAHVRNSFLGNKQVNNVKKSNVLELYGDLSGKGLNNGTLHNIQHILFPAFELAVDDNMIRKNPCKSALKEYPYDAKGKRNALSREEQQRFLEFVKEDKIFSKYYPLIVLILGTGLRRGEALGLTWNDIDLKSRTLKVTHQLSYENVKGKYRFGIKDTKSEAGHRTIPLANEVVAQLQYLKTVTYFTGSKIVVDGYNKFVFLNSRQNNLMIPRQFSDSLMLASAKYNEWETLNARKENREPEYLPEITSHVLRHTACTRMAEAGMDLKVIQVIMGHSNVELTMNIYNHVDFTRISTEMDKVEAALLLG